MPLSPFALDVILLALLGVAATTDILRGKVYNALVYPAIALGLLLNAVGRPAGIGIGPALLGFALGFGFLLVPYLAGAGGAGDVKLSGAIGSFLGPLATLYALLYTFVVGAALSVGWILWFEGPGGLLARVLPSRRRSEEATGEGEGARDTLRFPFALAMLLGTAWAVIELRTGRTLLDWIGGAAR